MLKITYEQVIEINEADNNLGLCTVCGALAHYVEPDAREYECESCGQPAVFGAMELLFML